MAKFIGRKVDLGIGKESSRGTAVSPTYWIPKVDLSFDDKVTEARSVAGVGNIQDSEEKFVTTKYAEGDISGEIRDKSFGLLMLSLFGSVSTAGPTDSAYTHTFTIQDDAQHDSLTLTAKDPNNTDVYRLTMINSLELTQNLDEISMFSANVMAKTAVGGSETASYTDDYKFNKRHLSFKLADNLAGLSGATALCLKSLTLTMNSNVEMDDCLGTAEPEDFLNKQFSVEGQLSLNYEDDTWKEYMRGATTKSMEIRWTNGDDTIGSGTSPELYFQMPKVDFFDWTPNYALDEIVTQDVSFKANYDVANSEDMIKGYLVNAVVSY